MKAKGILLASVAGTIVAPVAAHAADMPVKAAPKPVAAPVVVAPSWAGLYVGVHAGAAWHKAKADSNGYYEPKLSDTKTGFAGGGLIGYNLQSGIVVYGVEADITGLNGKATDFKWVGDGSQAATRDAKYDFQSKIDWMATLRARLGVTTGNLLIYVTGGVAWAEINNKLTYTDHCCFGGARMTWSDNKTKTAPVFGGGFEYMFSPNWIGRVEGLWADFGTSDKIKMKSRDFPTISSKTTTFNNKVTVVRGALSYKF